MFGLMTRKAHEAILDRKDDEAYKAWITVADERDKFREQVRDTCARAEKAERHANMADNQTKAAIGSRDDWKAKFTAAAKDLAAQSDEIAALKMSANLDNDTIVGLRAQLEAAEQVIAELKPDAEKHRAKVTRDAEQKKAKRAAARKSR